MKNISKLAILILLFNCIMCLSAKAQLGEAARELAQKKQLKEQKKQKIKECIQIGLIIGGVFAVPMLIVSTTLIISTIKEKKHERH